MDIIRFQVGTISVEIHPDTRSAGMAAAKDAAGELRRLGHGRDSIGVLFATGGSQLEVLRAMVLEPHVPWSKINGFHLDEYVGLDVNHSGSFRRYLRDHLTSRVQIADFHEIDGEVADPEVLCRRYAKSLQDADPQLCLMGIGENGHLAFNDPGVADFNDPKPMKIVELDDICREQQAAEGWFEAPEDVPARALTVTIPTLMRVPCLIVSVPGIRKAQIVRRALQEAISPRCPATILRTHPNVTLFLDQDSASELSELVELRAKA